MQRKMYFYVVKLFSVNKTATELKNKTKNLSLYEFYDFLIFKMDTL